MLTGSSRAAILFLVWKAKECRKNRRSYSKSRHSAFGTIENILFFSFLVVIIKRIIKKIWASWKPLTILTAQQPVWNYNVNQTLLLSLPINLSIFGLLFLLE